MNSILEVSGLSKKYEGFLLDNISFSVPSGLIMGFIGPNGAGKTTTIKLILNMISFESGEIKLFDMDNKKNAIPINEQIGIVMDSPFFVDEWSVSDVEKAVSSFYSNWDSKKYAELLAKFNIDPKKQVKELSRGMKVKLMLTVAMSHDAKLLILDEPTSGLDPVARDELCDLFSDFISDETKSILFSTHITADLEKIADYITFILNGKIVFSGLKDDLIEKYMLIKGGLDEINSEQKNLIIGFRKHSTGFEGMIEAEKMKSFSGNELLFEKITIDEIIVFMSKPEDKYSDGKFEPFARRLK